MEEFSPQSPLRPNEINERKERRVLELTGGRIRGSHSSERGLNESQEYRDPGEDEHGLKVG